VSTKGSGRGTAGGSGGGTSRRTGGGTGKMKNTSGSGGGSGIGDASLAAPITWCGSRTIRHA